MPMFKTPLNIREQNNRYRKRYPERCKEYARKSYHKRKNDPKNIIAFLLRNAQQRAKQKELEFSLTKEDIILPEICPIMKVPFQHGSKRYGYSLDRIDNTRGYTKDNIQVISTLANYMKWDTTHEERVAFATWVLSLEGGLAA